MLAARWIRQELAGLPNVGPAARLQDRYSIRCAPQVLGVLLDALEWFRSLLTTEVNGVSDNPVIDPERQLILHGGNFYAGHVAFAMDGLKTAVANAADLLDRQLVLLCLPKESAGLPENLVGEQGDAACTHHGFKAMSITASALTAEALKLTVPASAFSRSTESHNQDKVPMATIASRDALRVVELTEQVVAISILAVCQAAELRARDLPDDDRPRNLGTLHTVVREHVPVLTADRRMDLDIQKVLQLIRNDAFSRAECEEE
jgi:histidine ammonia-lyase